MKARVFVTLKSGVLDPQGKAIHHALEGLGLGGARGGARGRAPPTAAVLGPQGEAIAPAREGLGFDGVRDVRAGKLIELDLADGTSEADIEAMCRKLLANTVIENFRIERLEEAEGAA